MKITDAETLATGGNSNQELDTLYKRNTYLKRMPDGSLYLHHTGGAMMNVPRPTRVDRAEAIQWVIDNARDVCTDFGYTEEMATQIVDGPGLVEPTHELARFTSEELQGELNRRATDCGVDVSE